VDIDALVQGVSAVLMPVLPSLAEFGGKMAESAAEKIGEDLWEGGKKIWEKLRSPFELRPAALEATKDVIATPNDGDVQAAFRQQLKKILSQDHALAVEIERMLGQLQQQNVTVIASGDRSVAGVNFINSTITTGDSHSSKPE
jgi:hypothetical protein